MSRYSKYPPFHELRILIRGSPSSFNYLMLLEMVRHITNYSSIVAMIPERIADSEKLQIDTFGKEESLPFSSGGNTIRAIRGMLACQMCGNTTQMNYEWVDASKIRHLKDKAAKEAGMAFVCTNDAITSWFMNEAKCPMGVMAINWKGRLRGHTVLHAGNYENMIKLCNTRIDLSIFDKIQAYCGGI